MVMAARARDAVPPLPSALGGSLRVADGVTFIEDDEGSGSVFLWGRAAWSWAAGNRVARRLAAVQLVETKAARQRQVAAAFRVNEDSLIIWRREYATHGAAGLAGRRPGPKGPSKLTPAKWSEIRTLRAEGLTLAAVAERVGLSTDTVRRALTGALMRPTAYEPVGAHALVPLPRPTDFWVERQVARAGVHTETPLVCEGRALPLAGALLLLPTLEATGLLDAADRLFGMGRCAGNGLRTLMLSMVFACLLDEPGAAVPTHLGPADVARLLGLDCPPDVDTMDRRMLEIAALDRGAGLIEALARRHLETHSEVDGILYFDGDTRAYHGAVEVTEAQVVRLRLSMGVDADQRVLDHDGDGVLVWTTPAQASALDDLRVVTSKVRALVGYDARPTVCFERGGWSPKLLAELTAAGFEVLAYGKDFAQSEPRTAFHCHQFSGKDGRIHDYLLADHDVRLSYDGGRRHFSCRRITRLDPRAGHQTQIVTTRRDRDPATIAHATFHKWGQERFVDDMRADHGLDALAPELQRIHDAVRMASYNAESALAGFLASREAGADEAISLLREAFRSAADLQIIGNELHVGLESLSASRRSRAIGALCDDLTSTNTRYPGTDLKLVYSLHDTREDA